jgi:hypothetical protein
VRPHIFESWLDHNSAHDTTFTSLPYTFDVHIHDSRLSLTYLLFPPSPALASHPIDTKVTIARSILLFVSRSPRISFYVIVTSSQRQRIHLLIEGVYRSNTSISFVNIFESHCAWVSRLAKGGVIITGTRATSPCLDNSLSTFCIALAISNHLSTLLYSVSFHFAQILPHALSTPHIPKLSTRPSFLNLDTQSNFTLCRHAHLIFDFIARARPH